MCLLCVGILFVSCLDKKGFEFIIRNNKCNIYHDNIFYGYAPRTSGLYVLNVEDTSEKSIYNIESKKIKSNDLNTTYLWHCRLGHINEKRISKLHQNELLNSFEYESFETCESYLLEKMTKTPFTGQSNRANDLLGLIHYDVCGLLSTTIRGGFQYFITFTDDFSRYGYVYLMKHKSESFEKFKVFKNQV